MSAQSAPRSDERRRRRWVDARIQGRLLATLLALEVALVLAALWLLERRMGAAIEAQLYRVHFAQLPSPGEMLLPAVGVAMLVLLAVNCLAVFAIEWRWAARARAIVSRFAALARRTGELDFSQDPPAPDAHPALREMHAWREVLRARHGALLAAAAALDPELDPNDAAAVARQREAVTAVRDLLPGSAAE